MIINYSIANYVLNFQILANIFFNILQNIFLLEYFENI